MGRISSAAYAEELFLTWDFAPELHNVHQCVRSRQTAGYGKEQTVSFNDEILHRNLITTAAVSSKPDNNVPTHHLMTHQRIIQVGYQCS